MCERPYRCKQERRQNMNIGYQIRRVRECKQLSQGDIEARTGLKCCYISRVENGHTVPSVKTLEKIAQALDFKLYQLLYDDRENQVVNSTLADHGWGSSRKDARYMRRLRELLPRMQDRDRNLLLVSLTQMVRTNKHH